MARRPRRKSWESVHYTHPVFRPYATALGQIALAWNGLHESMSLLFCSLMGGGFSNQFLAVWHALKNDRAQRDILLAAAESSADRMSDEQREKIVAAIKWIRGQANAVEDARDDALHSPLWGYPPVSSVPNLVVPITGLGHVRAKKLMAKKSLLSEFRWCRDAAVVLEDYVKALNQHLTDGAAVWPETPSLPNRGETKMQKAAGTAPRIRTPRRQQ